MEKEKIFELLEQLVKTAIPELKNKIIMPTDTFNSLGVHSLARIDIISIALEKLSLQASQLEFFRIVTLGELTNFLHSKQRII